MELKRFQLSFNTVVSEVKSGLKSHVLLSCADHGYYIDQLALFFDDAGLMPGVRVALQPTLNYDEHTLSELEAALEDDLNNIVFHYVYNARHKISAEDSRTVVSIPHVSEYISQLVIASQN